jgi:hypothetical protein
MLLFAKAVLSQSPLPYNILNKMKVEIHHASSEKDRRNFELFAGRETAKKTSVWV